MNLDDQIASKKRELNAVRTIRALTTDMRRQLDELAIQVREMKDNADRVAQVMSNWDSIVRSISQASLSLLQYAEGDYEVGTWNNGPEDLDKEPPLPETLVRVKVDGEQEANVAQGGNG
ncbi:LAMI_0H10000g1_1 [Lachancea mirantina]|uniref:DASH complex subunit DAD2 n=1 Tax=Lachancea mirantina TaxID=1230905 RepID=A0A1G4KGL9_9SACH|nr:LAMI_0H10000g1_1 [Lachancea mirantina]